MLISGDVETYKKDVNGYYNPILDATGRYFVIGCIYKENGHKKVFYNKKDMWEYIIKLGETEYKRNRKLTIYFHNAKYDMYNIMDLEDKHIRWFCENPFIAGYYKEIIKEFDEKEYKKWVRYAKFNKIYYRIINDEQLIGGKVKISYNKEIIKFLDTMAIFKMSLSEVGKIIDMPKMVMPEEPFKELTKKKLTEIGEYCANDCKITLESVLYLKKKLRNEGINMRNICTIGQVAISYIINKLKEKNREDVLISNNRGELTEFIYKTRNREEIHSAYRGGYVRVWKTGILDNIYDIDCNGLYPFSLINMDFPNLVTETKVYNPLLKMELNNLLGFIGVSRCLIYNKSNEYGLLLSRLKQKSYIPKKGKYMIGTWTHTELREAVKEGYEILDIEWSVLWKNGENPFKDIFKELYEKRLSSLNKFDNLFYKSIMNFSIGKFGQTKINQELFIDSVEMIQDYLRNNVKVLRGIEQSTNLVYSRQNSYEMKKYYCPIIPTLVTAYARIYMYYNNKKIPLNKLVYQDTDSIIFQGDYLNKFNIGERLGEFKIEKDIETGEDLINTNALIWGTKTKMIGNNLTVSGLFKKGLLKEDFVKGKVKNKRLIGIRNIKEDLLGKFVDEERDLKLQMNEFNKSEELLENEKIYIDEEIKDISFFVPMLNKLCITFINCPEVSSKVY